jgi:beta-phosphoglucomutase
LKKPESWHFKYLVNKKRELFEFDQIKPFQSISGCLNQLKKHFKLAIVSGSNRSMVENVVNKFFPKFFEVIITGDDSENGKPDPVPFLKAIEKLEIPKNECIVIENSPMGIIAAKKAEIYCVAVATMLEPDKLQHADLVFKDHSALFAFLKSLFESK